MIREPLTTSKLNHSDHELTEAFRALRPTVAYGTRSFPSVAQYRRAVAELEETARWDRPRVLAAAQRDWHIRGQNGCVFARLAALAAGGLRWDYVVADFVPGVSTTAAVGEMVRDHAAADGVEVLSLLVPGLTTADEVVRFVRELAESSAFWLERDDVIDELVVAHLRYPVPAAPDDVQAWVMGFGPFDWMPGTRRSPYFELVIRVREKNPWLFHRLNQDRGVAHLADVPLNMPQHHWEHRWQSTRRRTRMILQKEPDSYSAAKCTLAIPLAELDGNGSRTTDDPRGTEARDPGVGDAMSILPDGAHTSARDATG